MELEKSNSILKREVKKRKPVTTLKQSGPITYSGSLIKSHQEIKQQAADF